MSTINPPLNNTPSATNPKNPQPNSGMDTRASFSSFEGLDRQVREMFQARPLVSMAGVVAAGYVADLWMNYQSNRSHTKANRSESMTRESRENSTRNDSGGTEKLRPSPAASLTTASRSSSRPEMSNSQEDRHVAK